jgi:spoIIIJ-associated protein
MKTDETNDSRQEFKGKNLEEAISLAEHVLKLNRPEMNYEIVTEKTKLFGLKSKEIVIRAWPKEPLEETPVQRFLEALMKIFPLKITFQVKRKDDFLFVVFDGEDKQLLLWKDGSLLLALQHILNKISTSKVQVDCEFFRKRKERKLKDFANQVGRGVAESGKQEILEPMNPYERRIIHMTINQIQGVTSESIGEGFLKRVKIFPVQKENLR